MARLRSNFKSGTLSASIIAGTTTLSSAAFATLPVVASPDVLAIVLDPDAGAGAPEIVFVTAHTASATTVTVTRGQESTTARAHASGVAWRHAATAADFDSSGTFWITDYGASPTATAAVNRAAIQAAIDAANTLGAALSTRITVWVPPGTFLLDAVDYLRDDTTIFGAQSLKLRDNVVLDGIGTLKTQNGAYGGGALYGMIRSRNATRLSNSKIRNITLDGNKANQVASTQCSNVLLATLDDVEVTGVRSINANGNGIQLFGETTSFMTNIRIHDNTVKDCSFIGIQASQFDGLAIADNTVKTCVDNGIDVYGEDGTTVCHGQNFTISGNVVTSTRVGVFLETVRHGSATGNTIKDSVDLGVSINRINGASQNLLVEGNTIVGASIHAVRVTGDCHADGVHIKGNTLNGYTVSGVELGNTGANVSYVTLSENHFAGSGLPWLRIIATNASFITARSNYGRGFTAAVQTIVTPTIIQIEPPYSLESTDSDAWTSYTPALTGGTWAVGNGVFVAAHKRVRSTVHFRIQFQFGSTTATDGAVAPKMSLPFTAAAGQSPVIPFASAYFDFTPGSQGYAGQAFMNTTTTLQFAVIGASGIHSAVTTTSPTTWAAGDVITVRGTYEAA